MLFLNLSPLICTKLTFAASRNLENVSSVALLHPIRATAPRGPVWDRQPPPHPCVGGCREGDFSVAVSRFRSSCSLRRECHEVEQGRGLADSSLQPELYRKLLNQRNYILDQSLLVNRTFSKWAHETHFMYNMLHIQDAEKLLFKNRRVDWGCRNKGFEIGNHWSLMRRLFAMHRQNDSSSVAYLAA